MRKRHDSGWTEWRVGRIGLVTGHRFPIRFANVFRQGQYVGLATRYFSLMAKVGR